MARKEVKKRLYIRRACPKCGVDNVRSDGKGFYWCQGKTFTPFPNSPNGRQGLYTYCDWQDIKMPSGPETIRKEPIMLQPVEAYNQPPPQKPNVPNTYQPLMNGYFPQQNPYGQVQNFNPVNNTSVPPQYPPRQKSEEEKAREKFEHEKASMQQMQQQMQQMQQMQQPMQQQQQPIYPNQPPQVPPTYPPERKKIVEPSEQLVPPSSQNEPEISVENEENFTIED